MSSLDQYPNNPGSFNSLKVQNPNLSHDELLTLHSDEIHKHMLALQAFHGVSAEDLHAMQIGTYRAPEAA